MKIVHCIFSFNTGGAETMLSDIICRQARDNDVTLIIVNNDYDPTLLAKLPDNVRVILIKRNPGGRSPLFILKLNYLLRKLNADAINLHSFLLPKAIFGLKNKLWYTVHDVNIPMTYSSKLHGVIAISDTVKEGIKGSCQCQIKVISNGIDVDGVDRKRIYEVKDKCRIVQVARLQHEKKGQDLLITAIEKLKGQGLENITVDFIGIGPSENYLKQLAAELNVSNQVRFLGLKDREYIYSHLKDYDLMCHPSRFEGFGLVVAEGIAAGLPVLVADSDGPMEIIEGGRYGSSFVSGNVDDLAAKLKEMAQHYDEYASKTDAARKHVKANYSIDRMVKDYLAAYEQ